MNHWSPRVAIVLVNWNGWRDAIECLSSLYGSDSLLQADVWLVDNESSDCSVERIAAWCEHPSANVGYAPLDGVHHVGATLISYRIWLANGEPAPLLDGVQLNIVRSGANLGFAGGNNVGMAAAGLQRYTHFWLLNTDTVIRHDALDHLLERARSDARIGMVGSTLLHYGEPQRVQALGGGQLDKQTLCVRHIGHSSAASDVPSHPQAVLAIESRTAYVIGASMLVTAEFVRHIGPMCDDYFLYFEEIDWAMRGAGRYTVGYAPQSRVYHKVGGSSSKTASEFSLNLLYRNRIRFANRFLPHRMGAVRRSLALELLRHVLKGRWLPAKLVARTLRDHAALAASAPPWRPGP